MGNNYSSVDKIYATGTNVKDTMVNLENLINHINGPTYNESVYKVWRQDKKVYVDKVNKKGKTYKQGQNLAIII